jgi:Hypothetical protein FLILHELTA
LSRQLNCPNSLHALDELLARISSQTPYTFSSCSMYRLLLRQTARIKSNPPQFKRNLASKPGPNPEPAPRPSLQDRTRSRLDRWITRSPKFFKPTLVALRDAPASYIVSFAVLHEITAVVPLIGLTWSFHRYEWLPPFFAEGKWAIEGVERFGRYFRRKGWIDAKEETIVEEETKLGRAKQVQKNVSKVWNKSEDAGRLLVEVATAYAIVKVFLPLRIVLSVWWAPAFARFTSRSAQRILGWVRKSP